MEGEVPGSRSDQGTADHCLPATDSWPGLGGGREKSRNAECLMTSQSDPSLTVKFRVFTICEDYNRVVS